MIFSQDSHFFVDIPYNSKVHVDISFNLAQTRTSTSKTSIDKIHINRLHLMWITRIYQLKYELKSFRDFSRSIKTIKELTVDKNMNLKINHKIVFIDQNNMVLYQIVDIQFKSFILQIAIVKIPKITVGIKLKSKVIIDT